MSAILPKEGEVVHSNAPHSAGCASAMGPRDGGVVDFAPTRSYLSVPSSRQLPLVLADAILLFFTAQREIVTIELRDWRAKTQASRRWRRRGRERTRGGDKS